MVVLGGLTRLTKSGLSMVVNRPFKFIVADVKCPQTEWKPTNIKYPSTPEEWNEEFDKYKATPEYQR